ncbi:uncharacterized protein [Epargyreus clarus]|uniref:uncharacterized protein n=1 Tax=Epargyreus clarus TaxID=520877 RepID=UPI003C2D6BC6
MIYNDFFLFPKFIKEIKRRQKVRPAFNVLLFGMESISRMNFMRMMPRTSLFLKEKGSIQLLGYNKVGDNSYPNLFALLFSKSFKHAKNSCIVDNVINGSECVFLWNKFKEAGYDTALGSDSAAGLLAAYEYNLPNIPTDFYLQPFLFETRNVFNNTHYCYHKCLRNKYFYKLLLNWSAELLKRSRNKLFGIFWEESISHEIFNLPQNMDDDYYDFLKQLENSKYLDNSIIILFSDHGMRWGEIAQTEQGRLESRLPLFELLFPLKFQKQFQLAFKNIKQNRYRLTSPFDLHETLLDLVQNNLDDNKINTRSKQMSQDSSKISLFLPISEDRTCKTIGISDHWCTCNENERIDMNEEQRIIAANYIIRHINRLLRKQPKCHQLRISKILNATVTIGQNNNILKAFIVLRTSPGGGIFESTLNRRGKEWYVSGKVTRLNLYRYTSQCIQDKNDNIKMYCTCK